MKLQFLTSRIPRFLSPAPDSLLRNRSFLRVWLASIISVLGGSVSQLALPLTAAQVLHASALQMGILFACGALPFALFSLPAGVWIDRCSKRRVIVAFNVLGAVALASVPLAAHTGMLSFPLLCLVELAVGTSFCIGGSAQQVFVTAVVGRERLLEANSKQAAAASIAGLVGPILAGVLVGAFGAPTAVALDATMFALSALMIGSMPFRETPPSRSATPVMRDAFEGLRFVWQQPILRAFAIMAALCIFLFDGFMALYVLHATRDLGLDPAHLALVNTCAALGALCGATLAPRLNGRIGKYRVIPLGLAVTACGFLAYAAVPAGPVATALAGVALFLVDAGMTAYTVNYLSLRQLATPDALLGRMTTTMRFLSVSAAPIGSALAGYSADRLGLPPVIAALGFCGLLVAWLAHRMITLARRQPQTGETARQPDSGAVAAVCEPTQA